MSKPKIPAKFLYFLTDPLARDALNRYPSGDPFDVKAYEWASSVRSVNPGSLDEVTAMWWALARVFETTAMGPKRLTEAQIRAGEALLKRVDAWMTKAAEKRKPSVEAAIAEALRSQDVNAKVTRRGVTVTAKGPAKCKRGRS